MRVVVSPTPPVECLSTFIPSIEDRSTLSRNEPLPSLNLHVLYQSYRENKSPSPVHLLDNQEYRLLYNH